jgi:hypothetical protein
METDSGSSAAVTTGDVTVWTKILTHKYVRMMFTAAVADATLDVFKVQVQAVQGGSWHTIADTWTDTDYVIMTYDADLAGLADGESGLAVVNLFYCYAVRFVASSAADTATVNINAIFSGGI